MLLGVALMTLVLFCTSYDAARFQFTSSRYLLPIYLATPLFLGVLWEAARPVWRWARRWLDPSPYPLPGAGRGSQSQVSTVGITWKRAIVPVLATLGLLYLLASGLYSVGQTLAYSSDATGFGSPVLPVDRQIIAFMDGRQLTAYYTNDYWACYRVAFETNERLHCTMRGDVGKPNLRLLSSRYQPWVDELAKAPHPTYLLTLNSVQDQQFAQLAAEEGLPHEGYVRAVVGGYAIYYYPSSRV
jgi:hypothetical protein